MKEKRKKRKDSFFGIHFDLHVMPGEIVGAKPRPEVISQLLDELKPDYVQCDSKGHPGLACYPTKVGYPAEHIETDVLKLWRDLTAERNIPLYAHYSGIYDQKALREHPEWALVHEDGTVDTDFVSVFSPYVDEIMIPQLLEIALDYQLDGAWIDGDCWVAKTDYSDWAQKVYRDKTGKTAPKSTDDGFEEYKEFCRSGFEAYVSHYVSEIKKKAPDFEITSNWMYTSQMPKKPEVDIDFISGDVTPDYPFHSMRYQARCVANQGLPWDMMSWGMYTGVIYFLVTVAVAKPAEQLCQEAAGAMALGGGFEFCGTRYGDVVNKYVGGGPAEDWMIHDWKRVAEFCHARKEFCHQAKQVPQIGILLSEQAAKYKENRLFTALSKTGLSVAGLVDLCQDTQYSSEILMVHNLFDRDLSEYGLIIVPEVMTLETSAVEVLKQYAENGGSLMLASPHAARLFQDITGVEISEDKSGTVIQVYCGNAVTSVNTEYAVLTPTTAKSNGVYYYNNYCDGNPQVLSTVNNWGRGLVQTIAYDIGSDYPENQTNYIRRFFKSLVEMLFPNPMVKVTGSRFADVSLMKKDSRLMVNITNYAGEHSSRGVASFDEIPEIGPLTVAVKCKTKPSHVMLQPENRECTYLYDGENLVLTVECIKIHSIIVIE